jgi:hypothetical protein
MKETEKRFERALHLWYNECGKQSVSHFYFSVVLILTAVNNKSPVRRRTV